MKKLLIIFILLFLSQFTFAQRIEFLDTLNGKVILRQVSYKYPLPIKLVGLNIDTNKLAYLNKDNIFTGENYFTSLYANKIFVDTTVSNYVDSVKSTYWYNDLGELIGFVDAARDTIAFFKSLTVGDLTTNTTVAQTYIWTSNLGTDTIYGHSPIAFKDTIYPLIDLGASLGMSNKRWNNIYGRTGNYDSLRISYINTSSITYPSSFNSYFGSVTTYVENTTARMFIVINNTGIMDMRPAGINTFQIIYPNTDNSIDLGKIANTWKNIYIGSQLYTKSISFAIDSIGASISDTAKVGKYMFIVNCDAVNNDTVYLANIGITNGQEFTIKKIDVNATYVVVMPKGGLKIDGVAEDKFNTQWVSRTYIYKNKAWYIK